MGAHPGSAHRPVGPFGGFPAFPDGVGHRPDVGIVGAHPSPGVPVVARGGGAVDRKVCEEAEEGPMQVTESEDFGWPVVFLGIDVHGVVRAPGG